SGMHVSIINFGAIVTNIFVKDRNGKFADVVLGYDSLQSYVNDKSYFGAIVGRYGNRIGKGKFTLDGHTYQLSINDGENQLHGGINGFNKKLWAAEPIESDSSPALRLTYVSPDGEEGYPGTATLVVTYTLTPDNALRIDYEGQTDKPTIFNPTHHSYFNLSGSFTNTILHHQLMIEADSTTPVDSELITTGSIVGVAGTPMDFRTPTEIGSRIMDRYQQLIFGRGYDHNWVLRDYSGKVRKAAEVYEPGSGRVLTVFTDQPGIQFYSGNFLDGSAKGKGGVAYQYRTGLCLEAQHYPDSPNKPNFPSVVLRPGETYHQTTIYQFSTK
ncbi:MAG TPA: aldose epimerase family protein, partial [Bacteroidota bacterium]|nr:aldose epimerase family protein [Bacteroidota bacterium]